MDVKDIISDEEWEKINLPIQENLQQYLKEYIVPELVAFSIANAYYRNGLSECSLERHYNSFSDVVITHFHLSEVSNQILNILKIKYSLIITNDNPMEIKRISDL